MRTVQTPERILNHLHSSSPLRTTTPHSLYLDATPSFNYEDLDSNHRLQLYYIIKLPIIIPPHILVYTFNSPNTST